MVGNGHDPSYDDAQDAYVTKFSTSMFTRVTEGPHVTNPTRAGGVSFVDYNGDGFLDLFVTNYDGGNKLFHNLGGAAFADSTCGVLQTEMTAWGMGWSDYDNDGDVDLYVSNHTWEGLPNHMFRNDSIVGTWLRVDLIGTLSNRFGVGAKVVVNTAQGQQMREISAGAGYMSQQAMYAQFGFNGAPMTADVTVFWPSGIVQTLTDQILNGQLIITEMSSTTGADLNKPLVFQTSNHPNPFNPSTTIKFTLPEAAAVTMQIFDVSGRLVNTLVSDASYDSGSYQVVWDGKNPRGQVVSSGVYFYRVDAGEYSKTRRMTLLK